MNTTRYHLIRFITETVTYKETVIQNRQSNLWNHYNHQHSLYQLTIKSILPIVITGKWI